MIWIGLDPGRHTGVAVWDGKHFLSLDTLYIHEAMELVLEYKAHGAVTVIFEDARQRKWFGADSNAKQQGAGSVKRDCSIWEDFLTDKGIYFQMQAPMKGGTKMTVQYFKTITGWKKRCSNHARDAALLVFGR